MRHPVAGMVLLWSAVSALPAPAQSGVAVPAIQDSQSALHEGSHDLVVNGIRLWYRVAGTSAPNTPPVIYLHGGPGGTSHDFATLAGPRLEPSLRMVYLDQRGSGRSERPWDNTYSLDLLVEDVEGLRRILGVPQIALMGHSFGGLLALEYAAKYPEHVSRLVFVAGLSDAAASGRSMCQRLAETNPDAYAPAVADPADRTGTGGCNWWGALRDGEKRQSFISANMYPDPSVRELRDSVIAASGLRNTQELSRALFNSGLGDYRFTSHERLTMPVLIIAGRHDYQIGLEAPRELARLLPNAELAVYQESGHHLYLDEPERFARDVTGFLTAPPSADRAPLKR